METFKTILIALLLFTTYLLWQEWQVTHPSQSTVAATSVKQDAQGTDQVLSNAVSNSIVPEIKNTDNEINSNTVVSNKSSLDNTKLITVTTDLVKYRINPVGGDIVQVDLLKYSKSNDDSTPEQLLNNNTETLYIAPNGLTGKYGPDTQQGRAVYNYEKLNYEFNSAESNNINNKLEVSLKLTKDNINYVKTFIFNKESYEVDIRYTVINNSSQDWSGNLFTMLKRKNIESSGSMFMPTAYSGLAVYNTTDKFHKISTSSLSDNIKNWSTKEGWAAVIQHYFLSAWIPDSNENYQYTAKLNNDNTYSVTMVSPGFTVPKGSSAQKSIKFYSGPEVASNLEAIAPGLNRTVDYGILWPIASVIFWGMKNINQYVYNWGFSIIIVTLLIKLLFYRLASSSYRSMAKLRVLTPKIEQLKKRYGDDREKMGKAMMELYKKEKVNPLGGCLPMLIQLPFFIALYWVIIESVELRQAPFIGWITDLSTKDPYFILPLLMGVSMFAQQKLSPAPADPAQAKAMMFMPVFFTALFLYFPSGLVLYWVVNTVASIIQQWWIMKTVENESGSNKNSKNSKKKTSSKAINTLGIEKLNLNKTPVNDS